MVKELLLMLRDYKGSSSHILLPCSAPLPRYSESHIGHAARRKTTHIDDGGQQARLPAQGGAVPTADCHHNTAHGLQAGRGLMRHQRRGGLRVHVLAHLQKGTGY